MNLDALTSLQYRVVHRHQLLRAGVSQSAIGRRLRSGEWQRLLPAVYALFADACLTRHRLVAALLYAGADAQLGGRTALRLYGIQRLAADERIHLLVPHHRQLGSADFALLHRTTRLPDPCPTAPHAGSRLAEAGSTVPYGAGQPPEQGTAGWRVLDGSPPARLPLCPVTRAVADTARWGASATELRMIVAEAVELRLISVAGLRAELAGSQRNRTAALRAALVDVAGGGSSPVENDLRVSLLQSRVLPQIVWNPRLLTTDGRTLPGPEAWIPDAALGLQIDGLDPDGRGLGEDDPGASAEWERIEARRTLLAEYGALILQFPLSRLRRDPGGVRRAVERAYVQRRLAGVDSSIRLG